MESEATLARKGRAPASIGRTTAMHDRDPDRARRRCSSSKTGPSWTDMPEEPPTSAVTALLEQEIWLHREIAIGVA
jgi:hypothetical protein